MYNNTHEREPARHLLRSPLLRPLALVVDPAEVGDDDGNRQSDDEHAAERTHRAEDLPHDRLRDHVAVPAGEVTGQRSEVNHQRDTSSEQASSKRSNTRLVSCQIHVVS